MRNIEPIDILFSTLLIIGGLNWGLVGLFDFDLVAALFGDGSILSRAIYILVGLSALYSLYRLFSLGSARGMARAGQNNP